MDKETSLPAYIKSAVDKPRHQKELMVASIGYMLKVDDASSLSSTYRKMNTRLGVMDFRRNLQANGFWIRNLKLWLWWTVCGEGKFKKSAPKFGIDGENFSAAEVMLGSKPLMGKLRKLSQTYEAHDLGTYNRMYSDALNGAKKYAASFAYRKMRFLTWGNAHVDLNDLEQELLYCGLLGAQKQYPKLESELHLLNIFKRCIHNHGINIIKYHTAKSRVNLTRNGDGSFSSTLISRHASESENGYVSTENQLVGPSGQMLAHGEDFKVNDKVHTLTSINRMGTDTDLGWALHVLSGMVNDRNFSMFLGEDHNDMRRSMVRENNLRGFMVRMGQFLGMNEHDTLKLQKQVKSKLKDIV